jgi:magnesium transporter
MDKDPDTPPPDTPVQDGPDPSADAEEIRYGLTDEEINHIHEALHSDYEEALVERLHSLSAADAAELLTKLSDDDRHKLLREHSAALDPYTFSELPPNLRKDALESMPSLQVAAMLSELDSDDALDLILNLEEEFQNDVIRKLSSRTRVTLEEGLSFPEKSAGRLMQREFVAIPQSWTVGKTIDYLRAAASELPENFFDIFVITPSYRIAGQIPLNRLVRAMRSEKLHNLTLDETHPVLATTDQEEVARVFRREDFTSAPVVDDAERLIGVITIDDVVDVIDEEAQEDVLKLAGVKQDDLHRNVLGTTMSRFWWLFINLGTALLASAVISMFGASIEKVVALAVLMPIVASMGGNAGTQSQTVAVRALATRELSSTNAMRVIIKETMVGLLNGVFFAFIMGIIAGMWFHSTMLGIVIGSAMIANLVAAGFAGVMIPLALHRIGADPAVASTVFLTTVTDVIGFFVFLGLATLFLVH